MSEAVQFETIVSEIVSSVESMLCKEDVDAVKKMINEAEMNNKSVQCLKSVYLRIKSQSYLYIVYNMCFSKILKYLSVQCGNL